MKKQISLFLILVSAVYFIGCALPDTGSISGDDVTGFSTYSDALDTFPSFSSNLFDPSVQSGSEGIFRALGDITGPVSLDFVDIADESSAIVEGYFSSQSDLFNLFIDLLKQITADLVLESDQPIVIGEQSIDGSPVMDFGTFQISGTPSNMTLYWEVPFGIIVDPSPRSTLLKFDIQKQINGYVYDFSMDFLTDATGYPDTFTASESRFIVDKSTGFTESSQRTYSVSSGVKTTLTEAKARFNLMDNNSGVLQLKDSTGWEVIYYTSGDNSVYRTYGDFGPYIGMNKTYYGSNGSLLKETRGYTDVADFISEEMGTYNGLLGTYYDFFDVYTDPAPNLLYLEKDITNSSDITYRYSLDNSTWVPFPEFDSSYTWLFYQSGSSWSADDCVYFLSDYTDIGSNKYVLTFGKGFVVGAIENSYKGSLYTLNNYQIQNLVPSIGISNLLCYEAATHGDDDESISLFDDEGIFSRFGKYVNLTYFFDIDMDSSFNSDIDETFPGLISASGSFYYDHTLQLYQAADVYLFQTTENLLSYMENQQQVYIDQLDSGLETLEAGFSSFTSTANVESIAGDPVYATF